jgi:DNA-directed RNA polymerase subunit omega
MRREQGILSPAQIESRRRSSQIKGARLMAQSHDTMMKPGIEGLLDRADSKFSLVTLAARRARNINSYFNQLGDGLGHMIPPQVSSTARKPLSIAFEEISMGKIVKTDAPEEADESTLDLPTGDAGIDEGTDAG